MKKTLAIILAMTLSMTLLPSAAFSDAEELLFQPVGDDEILADVVDETANEGMDEIVSDEPASYYNTDDAVTEEEYFCGSLPDDYSVPSYRSPYKLLLSAASPLPEAYDARSLGLVTSVKNQGSYGTCWAFTMMAMAESNILKKYGIPTDLSEMQLVWFYYNGTCDPQGVFNDPLGNFCGDHGYLKNGTSFYNILSLGGNIGTGLTTQASWIGVTPEDDLTAYNSDAIDNIAQNGLPYSYAFANDSFHLKNARIVNIETDIDTVKQMILDYGAVGVSYLQNSTYMNGNAFYHPTGTGGSGHAVTIIGWDDNYSVDNFSPTYRPKNSGAWLIKNSWGDSAGDNGYFWMSYESKHGANRTNAYAAEFEPSMVYDYCYQYDGGFYTKASSNSAKYIYTANVYTAQHDELVSAVSFWSTRQTNVPYVVYVVSEPEADRPMKGKVLFSKEGMTTQAGYYTEVLPEPVFVSAGERFSVIVRFENTTGGTFQYEYDADYTADTRYGSESVALSGQSYSICVNSPISERTTNAWKDLSTVIDADKTCNNYNNRIKAFTVVPENKMLTAENIALTESVFAYDGTEKQPEVQVRYYGKLLKENIDYTLSYKDNLNVGVATATVTGIGSFCGTAAKNFTIKKGEQSISAEIAEERLRVGMTPQIHVSGAEGECEYTSSDPNVAVVDESGVLHAVGPGTVFITVKAKETENYNSAFCSFTVAITLPGDANKDARLNSLDILTLVKWLADQSTVCDEFAADVDGNGTADEFDLPPLMQYLAGAAVTLQ